MTTGTWSIDDGQPTQFTSPSSSFASSAAESNGVYFTTPEYPAGPHTLTVTFLGSNETQPMVLDYLLIRNGSFVGPSTVATPNSGPGRSSGPPIRVIVGAILGALVSLVLIAGVLWRRLNNQQDLRPTQACARPFISNDSEGGFHPSLPSRRTKSGVLSSEIMTPPLNRVPPRAFRKRQVTLVMSSPPTTAPAATFHVPRKRREPAGIATPPSMSHTLRVIQEQNDTEAAVERPIGAVYLPMAGGNVSAVRRDGPSPHQLHIESIETTTPNAIHQNRSGSLQIEELPPYYTLE